MTDDFNPIQLLNIYKSLSLDDPNEANTRLKLIDETIFNLLGWNKDEVSLEERVSQDGKITYCDYIVRTGMAAFVIEAKKIGIDFSLRDSDRRVALRGRMLKGDVGEAIKQARDYAYHLGVPFAAVTNGVQWIIFPAQRTDQIPSENWQAIVFSSIESFARDDIEEFVDLLGRASVIGGSLERELWGRIEDQVEERRLSNFYKEGFSKKRRNYIYEYIEDAVLTAFTEEVIKNDPELIEKCYVRTPERVRFDSRIRMHIERPIVAMASSPRRPIKGRRSQGLEDTLQQARTKARPISMLILGTVGSGKTTFLEYTRKVSSAQFFEPKKSGPYPHWIHVDMRDMTEDEDPTNFIYKWCFEHIKNDEFMCDYERCIKYAYKSEIDALVQGPLKLISGDEESRNKRIVEFIVGEYEKINPYVEKILSYAGDNSPVFLVIDNVDQFETLGIQEKIFGVSISIARRMGLHLILSMRESTFVEYRNNPTFDAFDYDPVYIDPPNVNSVLSKRFFIAYELLKGQSATFITDKGLRVDTGDLSKFIDTLKSSVLGTEVGHLIEIMASSDIRLALRMTREFLQHGYTAPEKALRIPNYVLPRHEALRAIMLGNSPVYHDSMSVVGNPFDAYLSRNSAQLLRIYILSAMVKYSSGKKAQYVEGADICASLREIGFADEITLSVLKGLVEKRFVHTRSHSDTNLEASYMATRLGGYIVRDLLVNFTFLENVLSDTFISDSETWKSIKFQTQQIYNQRNMFDRFKVRKSRIIEFYNYMSREYSRLRDASVMKGLAPEWCAHPFEELYSDLENNLFRATRSASSTLQGK